MARDINKVILIGRLGKDPDLRYTPKGTAVCSFTMATNNDYMGEDNNLVKRVEWHNISAWSRLAETCSKYLKKGSKIYCEGRLQYDEYEKDGIKRYATKIIMENMQMLDAKGEGGSSSGASSVSDAPSQSDDSDLPF
ncbi:MAG: single-stranded DNA-binding protein [Bacteroidetes bacterium]|nr:single-stranded DNA-binding protein [Bacteroidota bacterium]MBX7045353.1 single-stranded DNA-binding protein [Ignavibacteria bacterium]